MTEHAPDAWLLNYTNPMAMLVMALARTGIPHHVGLCHGTEHTASDLAGYLGIEPSRLAWQAAGINHMTWFLTLSVDGEDVYPALRELGSSLEVSSHDDGIRFELLRRFGYFVSESSVHNAEYYPWFLRNGAPGERHGVRVREYLYRLEELERGFQDELSSLTTAGALSLDPPSSEYAPKVIAALETNRSYRFMGNVANAASEITNLPADACVEIPCYVDGGTIVHGAIGDLPTACAALCRTQVNVQLLTVEGILTRSKDLVYQAAFLDPLLSAQLTLDQITGLVDEMVAAHGNSSELS